MLLGAICMGAMPPMVPDPVDTGPSPVCALLFDMLGLTFVEVLLVLVGPEMLVDGPASSAGNAISNVF